MDRSLRLLFSVDRLLLKRERVDEEVSAGALNVDLGKVDHGLVGHPEYFVRLVLFDFDYLAVWSEHLGVADARLPRQSRLVAV